VAGAFIRRAVMGDKERGLEIGCCASKTGVLG
jgi:hypothetical protein